MCPAEEWIACLRWATGSDRGRATLKSYTRQRGDLDQDGSVHRLEARGSLRVSL